uniref:BESS domain-containing protein n=1 Tax=Photinus pyralis TaxID=7054 RepID=A0A1Y1MQ46_PHOPY
MAAGPVRKYKYEDILQFILPQMSERETLSNVSQLQDEDAEGDEDDIEETQESDTLLAENDELEKTIENAERNASNDSFPKPIHKKKKISANTIDKRQDQSASSQLMSYILEEKRNERQKQPPPSSEQLHPVDAFLNGVSHTLKALNPILLNEGKTKIFGIVQELERKQLLDNQSKVVLPSQVRVVHVPQASPLSTYSSPSSSYASTPLPSPQYNLPLPSPEYNNATQSEMQQSDQHHQPPWY